MQVAQQKLTIYNTICAIKTIMKTLKFKDTETFTIQFVLLKRCRSQQGT